MANLSTQAVNDDDIYVVSPAGHVLRQFGPSDPLGRKMLRSMPPADGTLVVKGFKLKQLMTEGKIHT